MTARQGIGRRAGWGFSARVPPARYATAGRERAQPLRRPAARASEPRASAATSPSTAATTATAHNVTSTARTHLPPLPAAPHEPRHATRKHQPPASPGVLPQPHAMASRARQAADAHKPHRAAPDDLDPAPVHVYDHTNDGPPVEAPHPEANAGRARAGCEPALTPQGSARPDHRVRRGIDRDVRV